MFDTKETKKILEKLKKVCTSMSKFNVNSPCLLQVVRYRGEYEFILTHNPTNGDNYDFYKIFSNVTYDNFMISEEDQDCFKSTDERYSVPIIISTFNFINPNLSQNSGQNFAYYNSMKYDYSVDSFYIFPKFVLKAIKEEKIIGFKVENRSSLDGKCIFSFIIELDADDRFNFNTLFIQNTSRLENIYKLGILPLERSSSLWDLYFKYNDKCNSYLILDPIEWEKVWEDNKYVNAIEMKGANNHWFTIYHNDFLQKKIKSATITKRYENIDELGSSNIVSLYFSVELSGVFEYFKYKYYECRNM